jgi:hypothetical protein
MARTALRFPLVAGLLVLWGMACSSGSQYDGLSVSGTGVFTAASGTPCAAGAVRECHVTLGERGGALICFSGTQACVDGAWGACTVNASEASAATLEAPGVRVQSLSDAEECDNPCDPYCRTYDETPPDPIVAEPGTETTYDWETGSLSDFPGGLVKKGLNQPCETGADCQFNTQCSAPAQSSCAHSVCEAGAALQDGCNECASVVCAEHPECCQAPASGDCEHDPCARGASLKANCDPCVADVCAVMPSCCSKQGGWTSACVDAVASVCGNGCGCGVNEVEFEGRCYAYDPNDKSWSSARKACTDRSTGDWDLVSLGSKAENDFVQNLWGDANDLWIGFTDQNSFSNEGTWVWSNGNPNGAWKESGGGSIYTKWAWSEPDNGEDCARMNNAPENGTWDGRSCNNDYAFVCEGPKETMKTGPSTAPAWDASCVEKVATLCDAGCETSRAGICTPWFPGETDPSCAGVDLAVGVPCDGVIPVCNHGNSEAPAGIRIVHFPANSQQYPACEPNLGHAQMKECFTSAPIPPGECISVTGCPGMAQNREIMVNPGGPAHVDECSCLDNWSLYSKGAECGAPSCAGGSSAATQVQRPVDIIFVIDNSGSMAGEIEQVQQRINEDFAQIIEASGLDYRVIMVSRYGDVDVSVGSSNHPICIGPPLGNNSCTNPAFQPLVNNPPHFFHYSADIESEDAWCQLLKGFDTPDELGDFWRSWTPLTPNGWSAWLRPDSFKSFVVITDDDVDCNNYGYDFDDKNSASGGQSAANKFDQALRALAPQHFGTAAQRNYVWHSIVAMKEYSTPSQPWPPSAPIQTGQCSPGSEGPGTGYQALSILTGGLRYPTCRNDDFNAIFRAIASEVVESAAADCQFALPDLESFNPDQASVSYTLGDDSVTELSRVSGPGLCNAGGWYFDDPKNPTTLSLCPAACEAVHEDTNAQVWVELGCPAEVEPTSFTETYVATCPEAQRPVWGFFSYSTSVPDGASVAFRARTAQTEAGLASADWVDLATATSAVPVCQIGVPDNSCPIPLEAALGGKPNGRYPVLELEMTLTPSGGESPQVHDWEVTFSCPFAE